MKLNIDTSKISNLTYKVNDEISLKISLDNDELSIEEIVSDTKQKIIDENHINKIKNKFNYCLNYKLKSKSSYPALEAMQHRIKSHDVSESSCNVEDYETKPIFDNADKEWEKTKDEMKRRDILLHQMNENGYKNAQAEKEWEEGFLQIDNKPNEPQTLIKKPSKSVHIIEKMNKEQLDRYADVEWEKTKKEMAYNDNAIIHTLSDKISNTEIHNE